jgi:hypothetical protein
MAQGLLKARHALRDGLIRKPISSNLGTSGTSSLFVRTAPNSVPVPRHAWDVHQVRSLTSVNHELHVEQDRSVPPEIAVLRIHKPDPVVRLSPAIQATPHNLSAPSTRRESAPSERDEVRYWTHVPQWEDITPKEFVSNSFQVSIPCKIQGYKANINL